MIQIKGQGLSKTFTIRKMSGTVGVERIFPINLPALQKIEVNKRGKVRRLVSTTLENYAVKKHASKSVNVNIFLKVAVAFFYRLFLNQEIKHGKN